MWRVTGVLAAGVVALVACTAADGEQAAAKVTTSTEPSVEEQFAAEVEDAVTGEDEGFGMRAVDWVEAVCTTLDTITASESGDQQAATDLLFDTSFAELGWPEEASATVLHIGISHFCPEHRAAVSGYIARRGIILDY